MTIFSVLNASAAICAFNAIIAKHLTIAAEHLAAPLNESEAVRIAAAQSARFADVIFSAAINAEAADALLYLAVLYAI
jgi:hypothetical protein